MKNLLVLLTFIFAVETFASIEYTGEDQNKPTAAQIQKNRECFRELTVQGCGDPGEEPEQFRSCMSNVYPRLSIHCRNLMTELYGVN